MIRILAADGLDPSAVSQLEKAGMEVIQKHYEPAELGKALSDVDVCIVRSATKVREPAIDEAAAAGRLKMIIRGGVGMDNIDVDYARSKGLIVTNTPKASSAAVAELAIAHMLSVSRFLYAANVTMREGKWEKKAYKGVELGGKTLGLVGLGRIGMETAKRAEAFGMRILYTNRRGPVEGVPYRWKNLDDLLAESDFISLHMPAVKGAAPVIDADAIAKMKDGAFLINTARGALVDSAALCDALDSGKLSGAGIDVYPEEPCRDERLLHHPKVSMTPHIGASTKEAQKRIGEEIVKLVLDRFGS